MYLEVKEIKFEDHKDASQSKNYPENGFYITEVAGLITDLRFVDKTSNLNLIICPKSVFDGVQFMAVNPNLSKEPEAGTTSEELFPMGYASETFILDFTKILLGQRK